MDKKEIVNVLERISVLLELKGSNPFRTRAYQNAARALEASSISIGGDISAKELEKIKGIGSRIAEQIQALARDDDLDLLRELAEDIPPGVIDLLKIPTLGPKKIKYLYQTLKIENISELELACEENRLSGLPNFGPKTQENILKGIQSVKKYSGSFLYADIYKQAVEVLENIKSHKLVQKADLAGSIRRKKEIIRDIDMVAATDKPQQVMDFFLSLEQVSDVIARGASKSSIKLNTGIDVDIRAVSPLQYPYALHHFTGSKEHNTAMRSMAKKKRIKINEYGLFKNGTLIGCKDEKDFFNVFKMEYIPPELRENYGEIEAAKEGRLPKLVKKQDIKGIFHIHTDFSDGSMTMLQACSYLKGLGMQYAGITEHSKTAAYARGLKEAGIEEYFKEIEKVEKNLEDFTIFKGIESDILPEGELDYSDDILDEFDFVIIAIHSHFNMQEKKMTDRIITAIKNRHSTMLGHPTGRILLARDPYKVDIARVIDKASEYGVDLEINANPHRLDLDWRMVKYAKNKEVKIFINPDAHHLENLNDYMYGVDIARKGWLEAKDVANTMDRHKMRKYLKEKRSR